MWWASLAICRHSVLGWKLHQSRLIFKRSAVVSHIGKYKMYMNSDEVWLPFQNTTHNDFPCACFALKFFSLGGWSDSWPVCRNAPFLMYCCSPPQEGCTRDVLLLFPAGKKELMLMTWKFLMENVFAPACIDNSPVAPKWGGWFASLCVTVGLSLTWELRLERTAWPFCPELCGQILCWFISLIAGPLLGQWRELFGHAIPFPTLIFSPSCCRPLWGRQDLDCILAAHRLSVAKEAKANFCFGSINVCGQVGKSLGIFAYLSGCGNWMPRKDKLYLQTEQWRCFYPMKINVI